MCKMTIDISVQVVAQGKKLKDVYALKRCLRATEGRVRLRNLAITSVDEKHFTIYENVFEKEILCKTDYEI